MANHKQAEKRNRQRLNRTARNRAVRSKLRGVIKAARIAVNEGADDAASLVKTATSLLDRAGSKNALPKKRTARLKSRLAAALNRGAKG
jgi:small subunit ribosomal protein S20